MSLISITTAQATDFNQFVGWTLQDFITRTHYQPIKSEPMGDNMVYVFGYDQVQTVEDTQCAMANSYNMVKGYAPTTCEPRKVTVSCRWAFEVNTRDIIYRYKQKGAC